MYGAPFPPAHHVPSGRNIHTEIQGRDRFKFGERPVMPSMGVATSEFQPQRAPPVIPQQFAKTVASAGGAGSPSQSSKSASLEPGKPRRKKGAGAAYGGTTTTGSKGSGLGGTSGGDTEGATWVAHQHTLQVTRGTMSEMRENDAQTDPYTPDYYVEEGKNPEVLSIMSLKYGDGLPASKPEVEMIDRVKRRREVEENLPQGSDDAAMKKRLQMLEELESEEWKEREQHIHELQERKLEKMSTTLHQREAKKEAANRERVEAVKAQKAAEHERKQAQFQTRRHKQRRQLETYHQNPTHTATKTDRIKGYAENGSRGRPAETKSLVENVIPGAKATAGAVGAAANYDVRPTLLGFTEGVQELEQVSTITPSDLKATGTKPVGAALTLTVGTKRGPTLKSEKRAKSKEYAGNAPEVWEKVVSGLTTTKEKYESIQDLYRATPRLIRPDTPTLVLDGDDEEELEEGLILLQRLMRGRAVQNDFFEGKERCHGLIEELQAAQKAKESERAYLNQEAIDKKEKEKADIVDGALEAMQGDIVHSTLDYLAKELLRQRQAAAFDRLREEAQTVRQEREQAEQQRRVEEDPLRVAADERFRQIQQANSYTIHTYLSGVIAGSIRETAYRAACDEQLDIIDMEERQEVLEEEKRRAKLAGRLPGERLGETPAEEEEREGIVCDLMREFVMPQVVKDIAEQRRKQGN